MIQSPILNPKWEVRCGAYNKNSNLMLGKFPQIHNNDPSYDP